MDVEGDPQNSAPPRLQGPGDPRRIVPPRPGERQCHIPPPPDPRTRTCAAAHSHLGAKYPTCRGTRSALCTQRDCPEIDRFSTLAAVLRSLRLSPVGVTKVRRRGRPRTPFTAESHSRGPRITRGVRQISRHLAGTSPTAGDIRRVYPSQRGSRALAATRPLWITPCDQRCAVSDAFRVRTPEYRRGAGRITG